MKEPTFQHSADFDQLRIETQGELITVAKACHILHVLDFSNFVLKKFCSSSLTVESMLNQDARLHSKKLAYLDIRPDPSSLT